MLETGLIVNFKNFFTRKNDIDISKIDIKEWQQKQLAKFSTFQKTNQAIIKSYVKPIENAILSDLEDSYAFGIELVTKQLEKAKKKGAKLKKVTAVTPFNKNKRVQKQIQVVKDSVNRMLNNAIKDLDNKYLTTVKTVKRTSKFSPTLFVAIDNANVDFLNAGVSAGRTSDGRNMNIVNKFETDTQEWSQEMLFIGEGEKSSEVGNHYVWISIHAASCPLCTPWQNKVLIDDVYQDGKPDGKHPLLSTAIKAGLFHYNCRHNRITFIPGVDVIPDKPQYVPRTTREQHDLYKKEQQQRYMERQIRMWKRREIGTMSEREYRKARLKVREWQARRLHHIRTNEGLYRPQYWREKPGFRLSKDKRWQDLRYNKNMV